MRKENYQMFRELEKKNAMIDEMNRSNAFSVRSETEFRPLKEDMVSKVGKLQNRIRELEAMNKPGENSAKFDANEVSSIGPNRGPTLQREHEAAHEG